MNSDKKESYQIVPNCEDHNCTEIKGVDVNIINENENEICDTLLTTCPSKEPYQKESYNDDLLRLLEAETDLE